MIISSGSSTETDQSTPFGVDQQIRPVRVDTTTYAMSSPTPFIINGGVENASANGTVDFHVQPSLSRSFFITRPPLHPYVPSLDVEGFGLSFNVAMARPLSDQVPDDNGLGRLFFMLACGDDKEQGD